MREAIKAFFSRFAGRAETGAAAAEDAAAAPEAPDGAQRELRVAACAVLLELAHADQQFTAEERRHLEEALATHFDLQPAEVQELIALADTARREATDLYQFTSVINEHYDEGQRMLLMRQHGGDVAVLIDELYGQRGFNDQQEIKQEDLAASQLAEGRYAHFVQRGYRLGDERFTPGEYVSIADDHGHMHTYQVVSVQPL